MTSYLDPHLVSTYLAAAASIVVGLGVFIVAPKRTKYIALGSWLILSGVTNVLGVVLLVTNSLNLAIAAVRVGSLSFYATLIAVVVFATRYPSKRNTWIAWPAAAYFLSIPIILWFHLEAFNTIGSPSQALPLLGSFDALSFLKFTQLNWYGVPGQFVVPLVAISLLRARRNLPDAGRRSALALAFALLIGPIYGNADGLIFWSTRFSEVTPEYGSFLLWANLTVLPVMWLVCVGAVLWSMLDDGSFRNPGRWAAIVLPNALAVYTGSSLGSDSALLTFIFGSFGVILPVAIGYLVLRGEFPELDIKARFGIRSGTLAAIFLAVFFIISEAAAEFFGSSTGNQYWGIAGAGLLIFAIAPLQRVADRVANKAIPAVPLADATTIAWEEMIRVAWADGMISPKERLQLDEARQRMGLSLEQAHQIEQRVLGSK